MTKETGQKEQSSLVRSESRTLQLHNMQSVFVSLRYNKVLLINFLQKQQPTFVTIM